MYAILLGHEVHPQRVQIHGSFAMHTIHATTTTTDPFLSLSRGEWPLRVLVTALCG